MTRFEKLTYCKNIGWTYDKETGDIKTPKGKISKPYLCGITNEKKNVHFNVVKGHLAIFLATGQETDNLYYNDGNRTNTKWTNLSIESHPRAFGGRPLGSKNKNTIEESINIIPTNYVRPIPVSDTELTYEIIISLGKGKLTKKAELMIIKLVNNLSKKFIYYNELDRADCLNEAMYQVFLNWNKFDKERYSNAFSYLTEIAKRGFSKGLQNLYGERSVHMKKTFTIMDYSNH